MRLQGCSPGSGRGQKARLGKQGRVPGRKEPVRSSGALEDANCSSPAHPLCLALLHGSVHTPALLKANVTKQRLFVTLLKPVCKGVWGCAAGLTYIAEQRLQEGPVLATAALCVVSAQH